MLILSFILTLVRSIDTHTPGRVLCSGLEDHRQVGSNDFTAADLTEGGCSVSDDPRGFREADSQNIDMKLWPWEI